MHIMIVSSKYLPEYSGAAFRIHNLYKSFGSNITAEVVCGGIEYKNSAVYVHDGIDVTRLPDYSSGLASFFARIILFYYDFFRTLLFLLNKKFDILHVIGTSAQTAAAYYYACLFKKPVIIELVTQGAKPVMCLPVLGKVWAPRICYKSVIVAISEPLGEVCNNLRFTSNVWVRPNPVDSTKFSPNKALLNKNNDEVVLSMIAKFMPQKNQIFLLEVMRFLPENFKLVLAGPVVSGGLLKARDVSYISLIEKKISLYGLKDRVKIIKGFIDKPQDIILSSDLYLMPNLNEGLGTPLLEAQGCAVPVIANADEKAFKAHIQTGVDGYLLPLDAKLWAECIMNFKGLNEKFIQDRASFVLQNYSFKNLRCSYIKIFNELISSHNIINVSEVLARKDVDCG